MSFTTDLFISYNDDIHVKQEKSSDHHSQLDSSSTYESNSSYFCSVPQAIQNLLNSDDQAFTIDPYCTQLHSEMRRKSKPFIIIKSKKSPSRKSSLENFEVKIESEERLATRTKRIIKREKAKLRFKVKQEPDTVSTETTNKIISDSLSNFEGDGKTKKKMVQMIRNRISAQNSRDRKKAYLMSLEDNKDKLREENTKLNEENSQLLKELKELEKAQEILKQENQVLKQNRGRTGANCVQREDNTSSESNEANFSEHSLSSLLNSLNRPDFQNFTLVNVKQNKRTMGLATLISLLVVMNLVQSGNIIIQGENENDRNLDISGIQKKILQEASQAVENLQKEQKDLSSFSGWDLIQYLEPIIKRFGSGYPKSHQEMEIVKDQEDTCIPRNLIKVEDFADNDMNENNKFIKALFSDKINLMEEDDDLITTEEALDKKSQTSTFFCADSFECCTNERKEEIDEEQGYHKFFGQKASQWGDDY